MKQGYYVVALTGGLGWLAPLLCVRLILWPQTDQSDWTDRKSPSRRQEPNVSFS